MDESISEADAMYDAADEIMPDESFFRDTSKPRMIVHGKSLYRCTLCGQYKPKSEFYADKRNPCGIRNRCKSCYHKKEAQDNE